MKTIIVTALISSSCFLATTEVKAQNCFWDGYQLGAIEAESFCEVWERMYTNDVIVMPYRTQSLLCNQTLVMACKEGMAAHARNNYPLCTQLVRSGWINRDGENAATAWAMWQRGACNFIMP